MEDTHASTLARSRHPRGRTDGRGTRPECAVTLEGRRLRLESNRRSDHAGESEYGLRGAARGAPRRRPQHREADHRVPAEERLLQEDRRADERQGNRREELPEAEASHHRDRGEGGAHGRRGVAPVAALGGNGDGRVPAAPLRRRFDNGFTVLEILFTLALIGVATAAAVPAIGGAADELRTA